MKKLLKRVFGITASAMLFTTTAMPAFAAGGHSHHSGDTKLKVDGEDGYKVTLKTDTEKYNVASPAFGAYQIFTGTVDKNATIPESPGNNLEKISLADIRWGNAFGDASDTVKPAEGGKSGKEIWQDNIVNFVIALATTSEKADPAYKAAFANFHGFDGKDDDGVEDTKNPTFAGETENTLADRFYVDLDEIPDGIQDDERRNDNVNFEILATEVADVISEHNDRIWLQAFTDILGGYGEDYSGEGAHTGYVTQCYDSEAKWDKDAGTYTMKVPAGYYMILDTSELGGEADESYSARMLFVANDVTQEIKQDVPTLDKKILRADGEHKTDAVGVGDEVNFQLKGTLPSNYNQYTLGYQFTFTDKLSKGLTLKGTEDVDFATTYKDTPYNYDTEKVAENFKVSVKGVYNGKDWQPEKEITLTKGSYDTTTGHTTHITDSAYTAQVTETDGIQTLTVNFPCLKEIAIKEDGATYTLGGDSTNKSEILIDYTAVVDSDAIVSPATGGADDTSINLNGNKNTAKLTYSDNPQSYSDTDDTTEQEATVYTFGLDMVKVDATNFLKDKDTAALSGAKFVLIRPTETENEYQIAKFVEVKAIEEETEKETAPFKGEKYYSIDSWEELGTLDKDGTTTPEDKTDDTLEDLLNSFITEETGANYELETYSEDGVKGHLNISGLDSDITYTIAETKTPDDTKYAKIEPFTVTLTANQDETTSEYDGTLKSAESDKEVLAGASFSFDNPVEITDNFESGAESDGSANMIVANFKYIDLPSTGGVGTYWFYILGSGGLVISFILFRMSRKKTA